MGCQKIHRDADNTQMGETDGMTFGGPSGARYANLVSWEDSEDRDRALTFHWHIQNNGWLLSLALPPTASLRLRRAQEAVNAKL